MWMDEQEMTEGKDSQIRKQTSADLKHEQVKRDKMRRGGNVRCVNLTQESVKT